MHTEAKNRVYAKFEEDSRKAAIEVPVIDVSGLIGTSVSIDVTYSTILCVEDLVAVPFISLLIYGA
jgi:hypothetical protein